MYAMLHWHAPAAIALGVPHSLENRQPT